MIFIAIVVALLAVPANFAHAIQVVTGSYTGNGTDNTDITISPACQPSALFVKRNNAANELFARFSSMATGTSKEVTGAASEVSTAIKQFNSDGFRLGTHTSVNNSGSTHYYVAICDNGAGDISVDSWTGSSGTDNRNITMTNSFLPELVIVLRSNNGVNYWRGATSHSGDSASPMNTLAGNTSDALQSFSTGQYQLGTLLNANGISFYALAIKSSSGAATGVFTGNGSDNQDKSTIASPEFVLLKSDSATSEPAYKFGISGDAAWCSAAASAADIIQSLSSSGFQVGTNACANENAVSMPWFALTDFSSSFGVYHRRIIQ